MLRVAGRAGGWLVLAAAVAGCSAPVRPDPPARSPSPLQVQVPADGVSLRQLGFLNGPAEAFSLPRTAVVSTRVDQASGVTVVLSSPAPAELTSYLQRSLPATGFTVTAANPATSSLTFTGYGWRGSFTGTGDTSAVILRP